MFYKIIIACAFILASLQAQATKGIENGLAAEYSGTGDLLKEYQFHPQKTYMTDPLFMPQNWGQVLLFAFR